jgi:predicted ATPase
MQPEPPKVIVIDEPELGLRPQAITKLAALIKMASNKTQLIISTQSVNLVDCFDTEDIKKTSPYSRGMSIKNKGNEQYKPTNQDNIQKNMLKNGSVTQSPPLHSPSLLSSNIFSPTLAAFL